MEQLNNETKYTIDINTNEVYYTYNKSLVEALNESYRKNKVFTRIVSVFVVLLFISLLFAGISLGYNFNVGIVIGGSAFITTFIMIGTCCNMQNLVNEQMENLINIYKDSEEFKKQQAEYDRLITLKEQEKKKQKVTTLIHIFDTLNKSNISKEKKVQVLVTLLNDLKEK